NTVQTRAWLEKCYSESAPSRQMVEKWFAEFKRGRSSTEDLPRSGRPNEAVTQENIKKVHKIVLADRKVKLQEIADTLKISKGSVHTILHEHLPMRKLFSKWVPRLLTVDQKQQRVDDSEACLELFRRNEKDFLRRYVTMDETWIHHFTPESNRQSSEYGSNEEVISTTEAYFESKDNLFYKTGIEKLERRWTDCITLEGNYVDK
ncbi:protein GVQW3-like, partial [Sitodiplosis mosellana]|uniref:protein GVQW3-like n=1 Tax=Sitodiplosis mosellana TaxID=263140 RepID=UPI0024443BE5